MAMAAIAGGMLGGAAFSYLAPNITGSKAVLTPIPASEKPVVTTIQENKALKDAAAKVAYIAVGV